MKTRLLTILILIATVPISLAVLGGCSNIADHDDVIAGIVEAEHAFAGDVRELGMREGFLAHLGDGAVVFSPMPVSAVERYQNMDDSPGLLQWEPTTADASTAGDIGFTTGPWEFRPEGPDGEATSFGHYVSVWMRRSDGIWKLAIDAGVVHGPVEVSGVTLTGRGHVRVDAPLDSPTGFEDVLDAERELLLASASYGFPDALSAVAAPDIVVLRTGNMPARGAAQVSEFLWSEVNVAWEPAGGAVAESGDLGYTYGTMYYRGADGTTLSGRSAYLRVWERLPNGEWNVVIDLTNPIPDAPGDEPETGGQQ
jgi:ketosteroid isomerase-like protein